MSAIVYIAISLVAFALIERRLAKTPITGPMVFVALGLLAGILEQRRTGKAVQIDVAMLDSQLAILEHAVAITTVTGSST